jgi:predicted PurR-regulated permease PerM
LLAIDRKAARVTWTAALVLLLLAAVFAIRGTLFLFAVAVLFAYLLYPLFDKIGERFSPRNRTPALALTYLIVIGLLIALAFLIGSKVFDEARQLVAQPPDVEGFLRNLRLAHPALSPVIEADQGRVRQQLGQLAARAPRFGLRILEASTNLIYLVVIPIVSFFILKDGKRFREGFLAMLPSGASRASAERAIGAIHDLLLQYMRAQLLLCCTVLVVFGVVLTSLGVPYSLLLASFAFLCEFVPLVGPVTAMLVVVAVSALTGYSHLLPIIVFLGAFRVLQDYVISPKLMGGGVQLHPIWVIFGVFAGAEIGGVAGIFLSIPTLALARLLLDGHTAGKN